MISFLKGKLIDKDENLLVVDVNGVGYELVASSNGVNAFNIGEEVTVYTYMKIRETDITLFGFVDKDERKLFMLLCDVSGIGGKSAIQIMSGTTLNDLVATIIAKDSAKLSMIKGLGKKTAERIVVELGDKLNGQFTILPSSISNKSNGKLVNEAVIGLMSLGFTRAESETAVEKAITIGADNLQDLISLAIKQLSR